MLYLWFFAVVLQFTYAEDSVTVTTSYGDVLGKVKYEQGIRIEEYLGIPFAKPPVGDLRFRAPVPPNPWAQPYEANAFSSPCMQSTKIPGLENLPDFGLTKKPSEDCLYLNVWTPSSSDGRLRPVLVWIHGGGYVFGSADQDTYHGNVLAAMNDVVIVSINYRLGLLGYLYTGTPESPGNMGMLDQRLALLWVRDNIKNFGGDPDLVTIFGESAGSMSVNLHVLSPLSKGLFKRGIMMSGTNYVPAITDTPQSSLLKGNNVAKMVGCASAKKDLRSHPQKVLQCLKQKSADELQLASMELVQPSLLTFLPIFSDDFCPKAPILAIDRGKFNKVDILVGTTSQEAALFFSFQHPEFFGANLDKFSLEDLLKTGEEVMKQWAFEPSKEALEFYSRNIDDKLKLCTEIMNYFSDYLFTCPTKYFSERYSDKGNVVFSYRFSQLSEKSPIPESVGVPHFLEVPFLFGAPFKRSDIYTDKDREFSRQVMKIFVAFARTGVPELPSGEEWPKFTRENPVHIDLKHGKMSVEKNLRKEQCDYLRKFI